MPARPTAIIGASGALGFGLALRLAEAGSPIAIGSRDPERLSELLARARAAVPDGSFSAHDNAAAVSEAEVAMLTVPFRNHAETIHSIAGALRPGQLLIDATVPLASAVDGEPTRLLGIWQGSAAEQARELAPKGVRVVSALHTVSAASLTDLEHPLEQDVLLCGNSTEAKREAAALIERVRGLRCVDCGGLEISRITESMTALMIAVKIRYTNHAGVRLTGLPEAIWD
ncbi:MAG TPA: NADPH-dependent F420 reductase [Solirubrobacteraceae bacterium]